MTYLLLLVALLIGLAIGYVAGSYPIVRVAVTRLVRSVDLCADCILRGHAECRCAGYLHCNHCGAVHNGTLWLLGPPPEFSAGGAIIENAFRYALKIRIAKRQAARGNACKNHITLPGQDEDRCAHDVPLSVHCVECANDKPWVRSKA